MASLFGASVERKEGCQITVKKSLYKRPAVEVAEPPRRLWQLGDNEHSPMMSCSCVSGYSRPMRGVTWHQLVSTGLLHVCITIADLEEGEMVESSARAKRLSGELARRGRLR